MAKKNRIKIFIILFTAILIVVRVKLMKLTIVESYEGNEIFTSNNVTDGVHLGQSFISKVNGNIAIKVKTVTWENVYDFGSILVFTLKDENGSELATYQLDANTIPDNDFTYYIPFDGIELKKGERYTIDISSNIEGEVPLAIMCTERNDEESYCDINGEPQDYNLEIVVYE